MTPDLYDNGPALRDAALQRLEDAHADWIEVASGVVSRLAASGRPFTTDDVWACIGPPKEPRAMGAVINRFVRAGKIVRVGWVKSARPENHARPVAQWRGYDG